MHALSFGLLFAASLSACTLDNEEGEFEFCFSRCDPNEPVGPKPPVIPINFEFDGGTHQNAMRLASGGVMQLHVEATPAQIPTVSTTSVEFALTVISAEPHLTTVEITALQPGFDYVTATIPGYEPKHLTLEVAELSGINVAADFIQSVERLVVLPDILEVGLRMIAIDGGPVLDHSLVLDLQVPRCEPRARSQSVRTVHRVLGRGPRRDDHRRGRRVHRGLRDHAGAVTSGRADRRGRRASRRAARDRRR